MPEPFPCPEERPSLLLKLGPALPPLPLPPGGLLKELEPPPFLLPPRLPRLGKPPEGGPEAPCCCCWWGGFGGAVGGRVLSEDCLLLVEPA
jgi:hypothetical protein